MRNIAKKTLRGYWERNPETRESLESWYTTTLAADRETPSQLKVQFRNASILEDNRVVFNIKGNGYRLVVKINYPYRIAYVRYIGIHKQYDNINAEEVQDGH